MQRSKAVKIAIGLFSLFLLAAMNLWGRYPFYVPDQAENGEEEIQLAPQRMPSAAPNSKAAVSQRGVFGGNPYLVGPIITPTTTVSEAETSIAINPSNSANMVAIITDYSLRPGGISTNGVSKYAVSNDFGATWTDNFVPFSAGYGYTSDGVKWLVNRDPGVAIDSQGYVYFSGLYLKLAPGQSHSNITYKREHTPGGVYVCAGQLPNITMTNANCNPVFAYTLSTGNTNDVDRDWLSVDGNATSPFAGNVYTTWTHYTGCAGSICANKFIAFSRSTDHGVTWSPLMQINTTSQTTVDWSMVNVGSDGTVYVVYQLYFQNNNLRQHWLSTSSDGGVTFSAPVAMTPQFRDVVFNTKYRKNAAPNVLISSVPGAEYVYDVFAETTGSGTSIAMARSNQPKGQGGFTPLVTMNDSLAGQREYPAAAVDANGTLHVGWLDTRNSSVVSMYDVYATYSKDLGVTFAPNARITPSLLNGNSTFLGDYFGMTVEPTTGIAHPTWTNGGYGPGQLQTTTLTPQ